MKYILLIVAVCIVTSCKDQRQKAVYLYNSGNYEEALNLYDEVEKTSKLDYIDYYRIAAIYRSLKQNEKAIIYFNKSLELNKDNPNTLLALGNIYEDDGYYQRAIDLYLKALNTKGKPSDFVLFFRLGRCYEETRDVEKSIVFFTTFLVQASEFEKAGKKLDGYENLLEYATKYIETNASKVKSLHFDSQIFDEINKKKK
ncbi:tetratricopeptide repeat protein [Leptospira kmetyi]|uniref:tetratricopeptide repeat protein n=1 Tax=Leptospira kmetyi TaxID=408139 RepID=UPI0002895EF9|nr:tetratricopeptide repeat protein [Leptospira kmetyi]EQA54672.1 tetratricopeptide repeat protein [Leptospira kmetyi serovar Malaysia str. Bejo-Iso9]